MVVARSGYPPKLLELIDEEPISNFVKNYETITISKATPRDVAVRGGQAEGDSEQAPMESAADQVTSGERNLQDAEGAVGEMLLSAASKGEVSAAAKSFRRQLKSELVKRQEERLAQHRVEAALLGNYQFIAPTAHRLDGGMPHMRVKFKVSARKYTEEDVAALPLPILKAIIINILRVS